jgi:hypothetical protein
MSNDQSWFSTASITKLEADGEVRRGVGGPHSPEGCKACTAHGHGHRPRTHTQKAREERRERERDTEREREKREKIERTERERGESEKKREWSGEWRER